MGTYTTNYNLYMPTVGERGWGTLINGNYDAIDVAMKGLSNRITTVENEVNGNLSCTSIITYGTITSSGMLNANGGVNGGAITGTTITATDRFVGTLYGKVYVNAKTSTTKYNNDVTYATCAAQSVSLNGTTGTSSTITVGGYSKVALSYPYQLYPGIYIPSSSYFTDTVPSSVSRTLLFTAKSYSSMSNRRTAYVYVNGTVVLSITISGYDSNGQNRTYTVKNGDTVYIQLTGYDSGQDYLTVSIYELSTYYINVV